MEVYGEFRQIVEINPEHVIDGLLKKAIGLGGYVTEKEGKYYKWRSVSRVCKESEEISREDYYYVLALNLILKNLKETKN